MDLNILIQGLVVVIVIGVIYSLWATTKAYGGLIGSALHWIGLGMIFFSIEALDRVLGKIGFIDSFAPNQAELVHNIILLLGLIFSAVGFSRLTKIAK